MATCYTANDIVAPNDLPCFPDHPKHSVCCPRGAICSANKLCLLSGNGHAHRGSCTDRTWGRECPHFCLSQHPGDDGLSGVNMTLCSTSPTSTTYCCNDWTGRSCDCSKNDRPTITLDMSSPVATIEAENAADAAVTDITREQYGMSWDTLGPILATIMSVMLLGMFFYLARSFYLSSRKKDPTRNHSYMEHGRKFSEFFWNTALDEKDRISTTSMFSIGIVASDTDSKDDNLTRKASTKNVRFSVGRRSKSEGDKDSATDAPTILFRDDIIAKKPSITIATAALPRDVVQLAVRPTFRRQNTDIVLPSGTNKAPENGLSLADKLSSPVLRRQNST